MRGRLCERCACVRGVCCGVVCVAAVSLCRCGMSLHGRPLANAPWPTQVTTERASRFECAAPSSFAACFLGVFIEFNESCCKLSPSGSSPSWRCTKKTSTFPKRPVVWAPFYCPCVCSWAQGGPKQPGIMCGRAVWQCLSASEYFDFTWKHAHGRLCAGEGTQAP